MAEEQFTSRRARREAERLAAEQEFEARSTPAQPTETNRADLLTPPQRPTAQGPRRGGRTVGDERSQRSPRRSERARARTERTGSGRFRNERSRAAGPAVRTGA